jgi:hypothetical protein
MAGLLTCCRPAIKLTLFVKVPRDLPGSPAKFDRNPLNLLILRVFPAGMIYLSSKARIAYIGFYFVQDPSKVQGL